MRLPVPLNRVGSYYNYAQQIWDYWNMYQGAMGGRPLELPGRAIKFHNRSITACGPGGGPAVPNQQWPSCGVYVIGPPYAIAGRNQKMWVWGKWVSRVNQFSTNSRHETGYVLDPAPSPAYSPASYQILGQQSPHRPTLVMPEPGLGLGLGPQATTPIQVPRALVPQRPDAPMIRDTAQPSRGEWIVPGRNPGKAPQPEAPPAPGPNPGVQPHVPRPPRKGEKERKVRMPKALRFALERAYSLTETKDAIDAIFDAFDKDIQKKAPKNGRTMKGARIGEGVAYTTTYDKAKFIYDHYDQLDMQKVAENLIKNHIEDEIIGRMIGGAERFNNKHLNGNRLMDDPAHGALARFVDKAMKRLWPD